MSNASKSEPIDFQYLFESLPSLFLILTPELTIVAVSDAYLQATMTQREHIIGRGLFEVFPDNPDDPAATGTSNLRTSLERVVQHHVADSMAVQKYDIRRPEADGGGFEERYWSPINSPVLNADGSLRYIVHRVEDVTDFIQLKNHGVQQQQQADAMRSRAETVERELIMRALEVQESNRRLEAAHSELALLYERSKELEQLKSQFFSNVSHELRTPLTLILGPLSHVLQATPLDHDQQQLLLTAQRNGHQLLRLVNDLLDAAKLESGRMAVHYHQRDIVPLFGQILSHFEVMAADRRIRFERRTAAQMSAQIDSEKFERIVFNLVSNAFKFVPDEGLIRCELLQQDDALLIRVADNGPGVAPAQRDLIFERFRQADGSGTRKTGGTGLGLAIVRELCTLLHGAITVTDAPEGGALFEVTLPLSAPIGSVIETHRDAVTAEAIALPVIDMTAAPSSLSTVSGDPSLPLVLVVEDNSDMRAFIVGLLSAHYRIATAGDGEQGLLGVKQLQPDLVISDLMMPRVSGEQLLAAMQQQATIAVIPVLILTAKTDEHLRGQLLRAGAQDFLTKPFVAEELLARVNRLVMIKRSVDVLQTSLASRDQDLMGLALQLGHHKQMLEKHIGEQQHYVQQLRLQADALATSNRYKDEFLNNVSHELRTPLNCIVLLSEQLALNRTGNLTKPQLNHLEVIHQAAQEQMAVISNLLDMATIEQGQAKASAAWFNVDDLFKQLQNMFSPLAMRKQLSLNVRCAAAFPRQLFSDQSRLFQIIRQLLDNAIKFTESGRVDVELDWFDPTRDVLPATVRNGNERLMVVRVSDTGVGIDPECYDFIFQAFRQVDGSSTRRFGGNGLGLTIARQLAGLLRGDISVRSDVGKGSVFMLVLPSSMTLPAQSSTTIAALAPFVSDADTLTAARPARILLVDDDSRNVMAVTALLEDSGYDVVTADNGQAALDVFAREGNIDLVLMDMMMPVLDGYEATRILKQERDCSVPIVALTGRALEGEKEKCRLAGSDAYLVKPVASNELLGTIRACLVKHWN